MDEFSQIQKLIQDKNNDKRNQGFKNIETIVLSAAQNDNEQSIKQMIHFFKIKSIQSQQIQLKKSGLLVFQQIAQFLIQQNPLMAEKLVEDLTDPVLECFSDMDEKARFSAIDCLHNMTRIFKTMLLKNFNNIFEHLLNHSADQDDNVSRALCQLDNDLKQLVTQAVDQRFQEGKQYLDIRKFMDLLHSKMKTKLPQCRTLLTQWIRILNNNQGNDLYQYLPKLLEGLFMMLGESNKEIRSAADQQVIEFLRQVESKANFDQAINEQIIEILVKICTTKGNNYAKLSALLWIFEYLRVFQVELEEEAKQNSSQNYYKQQSSPIMSNDLSRANTAYIKGSPLRKTILSKLSYILQPILVLLSHEEEEIRKAAQKTNELLLKIMDKIKDQSIEFMNVLPTVKEMLTEKKSSTAESALIWMRHLLQSYSDRLLPTIKDILTTLIDRLNDAESTVVQNVMDILGSISLHDQYFDLVIDKILNMFQKNKELQDKKGELIYRKLCALINPRKVYTTICAKLLKQYDEVNVGFISTQVQILNKLLVQEQELSPLRDALRSLRDDEENQKKIENLNLFETLYQTFCYSPMTTLTLCFLSEEYQLAYNIIISFSEVEVNAEILTEISQLVTYIESPVFVFLRLQLLDYDEHPYLLKCLYGLMMLLPQGNAFNKLKKRLKNVQRQQGQIQIVQKEQNDFIDIQKLLQMFREIRVKYLKEQRESKEQIIEY